MPHATGQLSLRATTTEAWASRAHAPQQEKSLQGEACVLQLESSSGSLQLEKTWVQQQRPSAAIKIHK